MTSAKEQTSSELAIDVRGLHKAYGSYEAVRGINIQVAAGEVFALLGPNGAGKTTTVEILEGHRSPSGGQVSVLGYDPGLERPHVQAARGHRPSVDERRPIPLGRRDHRPVSRLLSEPASAGGAAGAGGASGTAADAGQEVVGRATAAAGRRHRTGGATRSCCFLTSRQLDSTPPHDAARGRWSRR